MDTSQSDKSLTAFKEYLWIIIILIIFLTINIGLNIYRDYGKLEDEKRNPQNHEEIDILVKNKEYKEALVVCEKVLHSDPNNGNALWGQAVSLYFLGRPSEAISLFLKVKRVHPDWTKQADEYIALCKLKLEESKATVEQGSGDDALTLWDRAVSLYLLEKPSEAILLFLKVKQVHPDWTKQADEYIALCKLKLEESKATVEQDPGEDALEAVPQAHLVRPAPDAILDNGRRDRKDEMRWEFDWDDVEGADRYHLYVIGSGAKYVLIDKDDLADSSYIFQDEGSYIAGHNLTGWSWRVRARVRGEWGKWSETRRFNVEPVDTDPSH